MFRTVLPMFSFQRALALARVCGLSVLTKRRVLGQRAKEAGSQAAINHSCMPRRRGGEGECDASPS